MTYFIHFYEECPATGMEFEIEITFTCQEEEEQEIFWGYPVSVPASNATEIIEVVKDGEVWNDYPDAIINQLYNYTWEPVTEFSSAMAREPQPQYFLTHRLDSIKHFRIKSVKKIKLCKRPLAA